MSWEELEQVVAARVLLNAFETSDRLRELGVPHALVGGLAVGHYGHPRATKDVDFIVGVEAFVTTAPVMTFREELASVISVGVIDLLAALPDDPLLAAALDLPQPGAVPIVPLEVLVLMKLRAGRAQDHADIEHLVRAGMDIIEVSEWFRRHAPEHLPVFSRLAQQALAQT